MIQYIDHPHITLVESGYTTPGWYFWDEKYARCYGPYNTAKEATKRFHDYCEQYLEIVIP